MYFVRRKGKVKGPLTQERLRELRDDDRLRMRDEISQSPEGPWQRLVDAYTAVFGDDDQPVEEADSDDEFWTSDSRSPKATRPAQHAPSTPATRPVTGTVSVQLKPWQWMVVAVISSVLATLGAAAGIYLATAGGEPTDPAAIAENMNASQPGPRQPRRPRAGPQPPESVSPAATSPSPPVADTRAAEAAGPVQQPKQPPAEPKAADPPPAVATDADAREETAEPAVGQDPAADVRKLLAEYYSSGDWQDRYKTVVPGSETKDMMRRLYHDVDWVAIQWSIAKMPDNNALKSAAERGESVRIDTLTNGNPHCVYVTFSQGRWRVDWLQSLNTLWLSR